MNTEQLKTTLERWNPRDMPHARELIHKADDWSKPTGDIMPLLLKGVKTGGTVLEIGCGVGRLLGPMALHFEKVIGLDIAPNMLALATEYLKGTRNITLALIKDDIFPVANDSADYIFSIIVFQHIYYREVIQHYLAEIRRTLRPSGLVRIQTMKGEPGMTGGHGYYYRSLEEFVAEFTNAGLQIVDAQEKLWEDSYLWVTATKVL